MKRMLAVTAVAVMLAAGTQVAWGGGNPPEAKAAKAQTGEPGTIAVELVKATAKITTVDTAKRTVTLDFEGTTKTITCGPEVRNFDQIKVGDLVKVAFVEALAVYIQKAGAPAGGDDLATITLAAKGAKPGMVATNTVVLDAKIDAVDAKKRTLTVTTPNGVTRTLKVAKSVKGLKNLKKGDDVVVRFSEALAILVEAPK